MNAKQVLIGCTAVAVLLAGCGGSTPATRLGEPGPWEVQVISMGDTTQVPTVESPATGSEETVYRVQGVGEAGDWFTETSVDGAEFSASAAPVPTRPRAAAQPTSQTAATPRSKDPADLSLSDFTYGFRIQISANDGSMVLAEERAAEADSLYSIPAYVEYERGWYKVRMGDFLSREEARAYLDASDIRARYEEAFIAETYVLKP